MRKKHFFLLLVSLTLVLISPTMATLFPGISSPVVDAQGGPAPLICYAVADGGDRMHTMVRATGVDAAAPNALSVSNVEAIELSLDANTLWGINEGATGELGQIDQITGLWTPIGSFSTGNNPVLGTRDLADGDGLAINALTDELWVLEQTGGRRNNAMFRINQDGTLSQNTFGTGADYAIIDLEPDILEFCSGGLVNCEASGNCPNTIDDIAIDPSTGTYYAIVNDIVEVTVDWLARIEIDGLDPANSPGYDSTTGLMSVCIVGILNDGTNNVTDMEGLGVFNDGSFYGTTGSASAIEAQRNIMWTVNVNNAQVSEVGQFDTPAGSPNTDFESVACLTAGANAMSGTVFCEPPATSDGTFNAGDTIQPNATLRLYQDNGTVGALDGADVLLQTTLSDASGNYSFQVGGTGNFLIEMDGAIIPVGAVYTTPLTTGNVNTASFSAFNTSDTGNDFGFTCEAAATTTDLAVTKSDSPDPVTRGGNITYTMEVSNIGVNAGVNATLSDPLPAGTTFVSATPPAGWSCTTPAVGSGGTLSCSNPSVAVGGPYTFTLVVNVPAGYSGPEPIPNTVTIGAANDTNPANNTASVDTALQTITTADLAIAKGDSPDPVVAGNTITYAIDVTNVGGATATNASMSDTLPAGTTFVSLTPAAGWSCTTPAVGSGGTVDCTSPSVAVGGPYAFTLVVTVPADYNGPNPIPNTATVGAENDSNPDNNTATTTTALASQEADLAVAKSDSPDPVTPGNEIIYTVSVLNVGSINAVNATLTDPIPAGTTFVSISEAAGWTCTTPAVGSGGTVSCTNPTVAPGGPYPFTIIVNVPEDYSGPDPIPNTAIVGADNDSNPDNNTASVTTALPSTPPDDMGELLLIDPALSKVGILERGGLGFIGETITWVITATNINAVPLPDVVVTDTLRDDLQIESASTAVGTTDITGQTVTFSLGTLAAGQSVRMEIVTTIISGPNLPIPNIAILTAPGVERVTAYAEVFGFPTLLPDTGYPPRE